jgi:hypothetical protein
MATVRRTAVLPQLNRLTPNARRQRETVGWVTPQ